MTEYLRGMNIAVTGAAGTVGQELIAQLLAADVGRVMALDNSEYNMFALNERMRDEPRYEGYHADVRDRSQLTDLFFGVDYVFHTAALKHVPLCELSPESAILTNVQGSQNVIQAAYTARVKKVLFTSSDKAVNPTSVMGTSKLMAERLFTAANARRRGEGATVFASTRFGNVAGSKGSVIPLFCEQIAAGQPVTVTDPEMTRFVMTLSEAVRLVIESMEMAKGGEVFVTKMPVVRIRDLAEGMIELLAPIYGKTEGDVSVRLIGVRPGEKQYEELTSSEESRRSHELGDFILVLPAFRNIYAGIEYRYGRELTSVSRIYRSDRFEQMTGAEIREFLLRPGVLPTEVRERVGEC